LPHGAIQARPMSSCGVCASVRPSVCVSVTFVHSVKTNKYLRIFFSSFSIPNWMAIFRQEPPSGGVNSKWGRQKLRSWAYIWLHCLLLTLKQVRCCQHGRRWTTATVPQVWHISLVVYCGYSTTTRDNQSPSPWFIQRESDQVRSRTIHNHGRPWIVCMTARLDVRYAEDNRTESNSTN